MKSSEITGIILAGGLSSRMGTDKGLMELNGKPLIQHAIDFLDPFCDQLILSSNSDDHRTFNFPVVNDEVNGAGPMGGIYSSLKSSITQMNIVLSCDIPLINTKLIDFILKSNRLNIVTVPRHGNNLIEPLCACYNKAVLPVLKDFIDKKNFRMSDFLNAVDVHWLDISPDHKFYHQNLFFNINMPEDLVRARVLIDKI